MSRGRQPAPKNAELCRLRVPCLDLSHQGGDIALADQELLIYLPRPPFAASEQYDYALRLWSLISVATQRRWHFKSIDFHATASLSAASIRSYSA